MIERPDRSEDDGQVLVHEDAVLDAPPTPAPEIGGGGGPRGGIGASRPAAGDPGCDAPDANL
jgi:hypothetical protein